MFAWVFSSVPARVVCVSVGVCVCVCACICLCVYVCDCVCACVQVRVLQEQLSVEVCARTEAQARVERLLQQNTDLLQHISLLVRQIQELEVKASGGINSSQ